MNIYRQGDVLIIAVPSIPATARPVARDADQIVLAYGEVTGHSHAIGDREADLFSVADTDDRFLRVMATSGVELQHEEHATIVLPPGLYRVRQQREYVSADMPAIRVTD